MKADRPGSGFRSKRNAAVHARHLKKIAPEPIIGVKYCVILVTILFVISSFYEPCFLSILLYRCQSFYAFRN